MAVKRPDLFLMVDKLYEYHFDKASKLYRTGMSIMIEGTIKKLACIAAIEHCDKQINTIKPNTQKSVYSPDRYSDDLVYWIAVKEILKNK